MIFPSVGIQEWSSCSVLNTCFLPNHSSSRLLTIWFTIHDGVNTSAFALVRPVCSSRVFCTRGTMHTVEVSRCALDFIGIGHIHPQKGRSLIDWLSIVQKVCCLSIIGISNI